MKFNITQRARIMSGNKSIMQFVDCLPLVGAGSDFKHLVEAVINAHADNKPVILAFGGHVIKQGLGPVVCNLMWHHIITHIAVTGAVPVHDYELATKGETSHDVQEALSAGHYGATKESAILFREAMREDATLGLGGALLRVLDGQPGMPKLIDARNSVLHAAIWHHIPMTVHTAIGADLVHEHIGDGSKLGAMLMRDFYLFREAIRCMHDGGVFICFGSAVVIPEVFLKALASSQRKNSGRPNNFTTAVFDFIKHYRPTENIVNRPTKKSGQGFTFTGHHEIMLPLLAEAIIEKGAF